MKSTKPMIPCAVPGCPIMFRPNWRNMVTCSGRCMEVLRQMNGVKVGDGTRLGHPSWDSAKLRAMHAMGVDPAGGR